MKQILSVFLVAILLSACQSSSDNSANSNNPASATEIPTHNPAHGQPHHDCSLAVGAPLVKKPAPAKGITLNPAHGQPGHRCDIEVGAPLT